MNTLLELTGRGSLMLVAVASLDRLFAARIGARVRRSWWLLVPLAFLMTVPLPVLSAAKSAATRSVESPGTVALSVKVTKHPAEWVANIMPMPHAHVSWALVIALSGSALYLLNTLARTYTALLRFRGLPLCTEPALLHVLEECQTEAGVTARVGLVVSERVPAPLVLGWRHPRILLPVTLVASLSREQLRGVLFHELAHVRAWDMPCTFLFTLVCALHWFNPAAHLALRGWTQFREEAADEAAITSLGASSNLAYGETLLCVLRATGGSQQTSLAVLAVIGSVGQLRKRILMIKQHASKRSHHALGSTVSFLLASAVLFRPVHATATPPGPEPTFVRPTPQTGATGATPAPTEAVPAPMPSLTAPASSGTSQSGEANVGTNPPSPPAKSWEFQFDGVTVVILPAGTIEGRTMVIDATGSATLDKGTHVITYGGHVTVTLGVPNRPPVTMAGENLTMIPHW